MKKHKSTALAQYMPQRVNLDLCRVPDSLVGDGDTGTLRGLPDLGSLAWEVARGLLRGERDGC